MENQQQQQEEEAALINSFIEITSSSKEEALFFLESHNYNLDSAISTFFENPTIVPPSPAPHPIQSPSQSPQSSSSSPPPQQHEPPVVSRSSPYSLRSSSKKEKLSTSSNSKSIKKKTGGIRTLADLNKKSIDEDDDDDDDDDTDDSDYDVPQEFYTGGEKSGMLVQDPSRARGNDVDSIFNQARQLGAVEGSSDSLCPSSSKKSFTGTGRLLSGETVPAAPQRPKAVTHTIIFWSNGFTVNDGPLRMLDDPQNASFLESIKKGECPGELEPADRRTAVNVNLMRKEEKYTEPEKPRLPFQGTGRTLGNNTDTPASEPSASATATLNTAPLPSVGLVIDENSPLTSIQIRLADGTRMVSRFNHHHTVRDIRAFIDASRPGGSRNYQLQTMGFPPKQLTDPNHTIEQDGLANSVVIQKF